MEETLSLVTIRMEDLNQQEANLSIMETPFYLVLVHLVMEDLLHLRLVFVPLNLSNITIIT